MVSEYEYNFTLIFYDWMSRNRRMGGGGGGGGGEGEGVGERGICFLFQKQTSSFLLFFCHFKLYFAGRGFKNT